MRSVTCGFVLASVLLAGGCCGSKDRGYVQREWSLTLRELGIVPVFPPREDVVVGDMYAYTENPDGQRARKLLETCWKKLDENERDARLLLGMSPRLARLDVQAALLAEYEATLSAPATPADYNSILGNAALAAALEKVKESKQKLEALEAAISNLKKDVQRKADAVLAAQRAKEDADRDLARKEQALKDAQASDADVSVQEEELAGARRELREREDAVARAKQSVDDSAQGTPERTRAEAELKAAERDKAAADVRMRRADEDLTAARAKKPDVQAATAAVTAAKGVQQSKADALVATERDKTDAEAKLQAEETASADKLQKAKDAVTHAESVRDAIAKAGERLLYAQPRDGSRNVYTADELTTKNAEDLASSRVNRLRLVGFPEFASVSFTQGDLSALIPIEAFSLGLNVSSTNVSRISVKVPAAESYGLPVSVFQSELATFVDEEWRLDCDLLSAMKFQTSYKGGSATAYLRVVTEVFYARAIDVSVFSASAFGVRAQLAALGAQATAQGGGMAPPPMSSAPINSGVTGSPTGADMLSGIQARLGTTLSVPGGSVQLVSYNERSVGLRRVFDRPVAIGFRGLLLTVNLETGTVSVSPTGGGTPTVR
jgi:hypothetical protein